MNHTPNTQDTHAAPNDQTDYGNVAGGPGSGETDLTDHIEQRVAEQLHRRITVGQSSGDQNTLVLSGRLPTMQMRQQAERIAAEMAPKASIQNLIDIERMLPEDRTVQQLENPGAEPLMNDDPEDSIGSINPEFTGQPLETNTLNAEGSTVWDQNPVEPDPVFFPPTDPVIAGNDTGSVDIVGGFAPDAMSENIVDASAGDNLPGDEALADAVSRALREDALTTELTVAIAVHAGTVHLRGKVAAMEDAENAEAVANRVPGVRAVIDEMEVAQI